MRTLVAIPVHNEERSIRAVLERVCTCRYDVLVVDDGSSDGTAAELRRMPQVRTLRHPVNRGYGAALLTAFADAEDRGFDVVVTMDSDGQHDPAWIPQFVDACCDADIVSASRYLRDFPESNPAPIERRRINMYLTDYLNASLRLDLTDDFCGFKAHRVEALRRLKLTETGYAFPMEFWVQAACRGLRVVERAVPRIYLDPNRSFGASLDNADERLKHYLQVFDRALAEAQRTAGCTLAGAP